MIPILKICFIKDITLSRCTQMEHKTNCFEIVLFHPLPSFSVSWIPAYRQSSFLTSFSFLPQPYTYSPALNKIQPTQVAQSPIFPLFHWLEKQTFHFHSNWMRINPIWPKNENYEQNLNFEFLSFLIIVFLLWEM